MRRGRTSAAATLVVLAVVAVFLLSAVAAAAAGVPATGPGSGSPLEGWAVADGYSVEAVGQELVYPTSLAAVPEPGPGADDPKLFVAELKGDILTLTRDDRLLPFAHVTTDDEQTDDLDGASQQGLAGICLDTANGFVFATFTMLDDAGILRNRMVRFGVTPDTMAGKPGEPVEMDPAVIGSVQSSAAHQIGNCQVVGDRVFVGVGDGGRASATRDPDIMLGKVLCLDVHGGPCGDGPWADGPEDARPRAFTWAVGFRNPFALTTDGERLFVAQNGIDVDGFTEVVRGGDYRWAGTDQEIAAGSTLVIIPSVSPVQMIRVGADASWASAAHSGRFLAAVFGGGDTSAGVVELSADPAGTRSPPRYFLENLSEPTNRVGGIAGAIDGLYVAPMLPLADGDDHLLRVRYAPDAAHDLAPIRRGTLLKSKNLGMLQTVGCTSCHNIGEGAGGGDIGPTLDRFGINWRLTQRLNASGYAEQVAKVDALTEAPFPAYKAARADVLASHGLKRTWTWLKYYLQEPRFDNPGVAMPNLGLNETQALALRAELFEAVDLRAPGKRGGALTDLATRAWRSRRPLLAGAAGGFVLASLFSGGLALMAASRRRRARRHP